MTAASSRVVSTERPARSRLAVVAVVAVLIGGCTTSAGEWSARWTRRAAVGATHAIGVGIASASEARDRGGARSLDVTKEIFDDALGGGCPADMATIDGKYCIDRYEASVVELRTDGSERAFSPFTSVKGHRVRAVSARGVFPQGYISAVEAQRACAASGKRLCRVDEWQKACRGPAASTFGYGMTREPGRCNDTGRNPVIALYGTRRWNWETMNAPSLNQLPGTLARAGDHQACTNGYGVFDMVGNLHEWVADPKGSFYGGYYQDTWQHGDGCSYVTTAHAARYHDYSTGFRCCADVGGSRPEKKTEVVAAPRAKPRPTRHARPKGRSHGKPRGRHGKHGRRAPRRHGRGSHG